MSDEAEPGLSLWAAASPDELAAIAASQWRTWPARVSGRIGEERAEAVAAAKRFAAERGAGFVLKLEVHRETRAPLSAIMEDAQYRGAVADNEIAEAEARIGHRFPPAWQRHLQKSAWFHKGWMSTGAFVWLSTPSESADTVTAWRGLDLDRDGMLPIGGDGASEMITIDARDPGAGVSLTPHVSRGWESSVVQCASLDELLAAIEDGTFDFVFADE